MPDNSKPTRVKPSHLWRGHHHNAYKAGAEPYVCQNCGCIGDFDDALGRIVSRENPKSDTCE